MPGPTDFGWSTAAFTAAIQQISTNHSRLMTELTNLETNLKSILGEWVGPAKMAYDAAQAQWSSSAANIGAALQATGTSVSNTLDTYSTAERQATQMFQTG